MSPQFPKNIAHIVTNQITQRAIMVEFECHAKSNDWEFDMHTRIRRRFQLSSIIKIASCFFIFFILVSFNLDIDWAKFNWGESMRKSNGKSFICRFFVCVSRNRNGVYREITEKFSLSLNLLLFSPIPPLLLDECNIDRNTVSQVIERKQLFSFCIDQCLFLWILLKKW